MKYIVLAILLGSALTGRVCLGQTTFEKQLTWKKGQLIDLNLKFGLAIKVSGWDKDEVQLTAKVNINDDRLDSLFSLTASNNDSITVLADVVHHKIRTNGWYDDGCPQNQKTMSFDGHLRICMDITYEVRIPRNAPLKLSSISADMTIRGLDGPVRAKSISGFVDMTWPKNQNADLALKSITGELYTDITGIDWTNRKDHVPQVGYLLHGHIGNGGPELQLESISNDIYLRKRD